MKVIAKCDIVIPVYNALELTRNCLGSIYENTRVPFNLILIDNGSGAATGDFLKGFRSSKENVVLIDNRENLGWIKAVNQGIGLSKSPYVCIMNNDTVVRTGDWLAELIDVADSSPDIGLVNPNFEVRHKEVSKKPFAEIDFCRGYCILIKRAVIEKIGALDEEYGLGYYDDDDYSVRAIRAGFLCVKANNVFVEHLRDSTFTAVFNEDKRISLHEKNKALFYSKWGRRLRLLFIISAAKDPRKNAGLFMSLVRRQHRVYLWNMDLPMKLEHMNIYEKVFPGAFCGLIFPILLRLNAARKKCKRYDAVFTDSDVISKKISGKGFSVYCLDFDKDSARIADLVDSVSRS